MLIYETESLKHLVHFLPRRVKDVYGEPESNAFRQLRQRTIQVEKSSSEELISQKQKEELTNYFNRTIPSVVRMGTAYYTTQLS